MRQGYEVVPINPKETRSTASPRIRTSAAVPPIDDRADRGRRPLPRARDLVMPHVEEAIEIGAKAVWMQLDVWNEEAAERAADAGLLVVMDRCPAIDHPAMIGSR